MPSLRDCPQLWWLSQWQWLFVFLASWRPCVSCPLRLFSPAAWRSPISSQPEKRFDYCSATEAAAVSWSVTGGMLQDFATTKARSAGGTKSFIEITPSFVPSRIWPGLAEFHSVGVRWKTVAGPSPSLANQPASTRFPRSADHPPVSCRSASRSCVERASRNLELVPKVPFSEIRSARGQREGRI